VLIEVVFCIQTGGGSPDFYHQTVEGIALGAKNATIRDMTHLRLVLKPTLQET
jgi:hypothetical protein